MKVEREFKVENNEVRAVLSNILTKDECLEDIKKIEQKIKNAESFLSQLKPVIPTPDYHKWKKCQEMDEKIKWQENAKAQRKDMEAGAQKDIEELTKSLAGMKKALEGLK